jgi:LPS O-antigen subunit length determinant protein (WzzB/FepE family)
MKKNNIYFTDNEIDLSEIIKLLWKEKILILSISIICGLLGYFYAFLKPQEFVTEIKLKNPPIQIFEHYNLFNNNSNFYNNNNNNNNNNNLAAQFISDYKLNFLSLDNLDRFLEKNREFDNFKEHLNLKNISVKYYFSGEKFGEVKEKNIIIPNKYFLVHTKELDGGTFFNNYAEFIKKITITEFKHNLKLTLLNTIIIYEEALVISKKIQLENPIIKSLGQEQVLTEPEALFYKGSKVLSENLINLNNRLIKLENDQINFDIILQNSLTSKTTKNLPLYFVFGLILGLFLSLAIIYLKNILK